MLNSLTSVWKPKPSNKATSSTPPVPSPLKQYRNQFAYFLRKQKQSAYRENKPISMESRPAEPGSSPTAYQRVPYNEREAIYFDKDGKFSRQPFSDLVANRPTCATYSRGNVTNLLKENIITQTEFTTLKNQILDFDTSLEHTIWKQIDVSDFEKTDEAVLFLPLGYYTLPQFLASKNSHEFNSFVDKQTPFTHRHLEKKREDYTKLFVDFLGLLTNKEVQKFLRSGWYALWKGEGVVFNKDKITTNLLIHYDKTSSIRHMSGKELRNTSNLPVKFVFSQYNVIPYDPNNKRFPKTKEEQEAAIERHWNSLDEDEREDWIDFTNEQMAAPFSILSKFTWKTFFLDQYRAIKNQQEWDPISPQRICLAYHYKNDIRIMKPDVYMSTVVIIEPNSGRMQGTYQVYTEAYGNKFKEKLQGK